MKLANRNPERRGAHHELLATETGSKPRGEADVGEGVGDEIAPNPAPALAKVMEQGGRTEGGDEARVVVQRVIAPVARPSDRKRNRQG